MGYVSRRFNARMDPLALNGLSVTKKCGVAIKVERLEGNLYYYNTKVEPHKTCLKITQYS